MYNFIVNPVAGNKKAIRNMKRISKYLTIKNIPFNVYPSTDPTMIGKVTCDLERLGVDNIIAVGGDGTINEIINALKNPSAINLGFIPSGTGNDFCYSVNISKNPIKAMDVILSGRIRKIDYMQGIGYRGINIIGSGIDIDVLNAYNEGKSRSKLKYMTSLIKVLRSFDFYKFKILADDEIVANEEFMMAGVCNGKRFGGNISLSPESIINDGKLDLILIKKMPKKNILGALITVLKGKHLNKNYCMHLKCSKVKIENVKYTNVDGEIKKDNPFDIKVIKGGINAYLPLIK